MNPFISVGSTVSGDLQCSEGYEIPPHESAEVSDGLHCGWVWDGNLTAFTDPFGARPLFYSESGSEVTLSPKLETLIARGVDKTLDAVAISVFLELGCYLGASTPFASIRVLPPRSRMTWDGSWKGQGGIWSGRRQQISFDAVVDGFRELTRSAIKRRLPGDGERTCLPLSGGLDSRYLLYSLLQCGHRPSLTLTARQYPPRSDNDVDVATRLAGDLRLRHEIVPAMPRAAAEEIKNSLTHFCSDEHAWFSSVVQRIAGKFDVTFDGLAGDTLCGATAWGVHAEEDMRRYRDGHTAQLAEALIDGFGGTAAAALFGIQAPSREAMTQFVKAELDKHLDMPEPAHSFLFWNRTRRKIALTSAAMLAEIPRAMCPFLDQGVFAFMSGVPADLKRGDELRRAAMQREFPDYPAPQNVHADRGRNAILHYAKFAADVSAYCLKNNVTWMSNVLRVAREGVATENRRWLSPSRLLYAVQLDRLRA